MPTNQEYKTESSRVLHHRDSHLDIRKRRLSGHIVKLSKMAEEIDMFNRDPNGLNAHVQASTFTDIVAEPDGTHSIDCIWKGSYKCFECWRSLTYKLLTLCCGICIAIEWGIEFAYIAFFHIWFITPFMKIVDLNCALVRKIYALCCNCCIEPICEAIGGVFIHFKK